jgi:hypothetical protein
MKACQVLPNNGPDIRVPANILKSREAELIEKGEPVCNRERQTNTLASCFVGQASTGYSACSGVIPKS